MRPRDWFSVGVRLFGVWVIYDGFIYLLTFLANRLSQLARSDIARELDPPRYSSVFYIVSSLGSIAFGFVLIYGAERITRWAFSEPPLDDGVGEPE